MASECMEVTCSAKQSATYSWREAMRRCWRSGSGTHGGMCDVLDRRNVARLAHAGSVGDVGRIGRQKNQPIGASSVDHLSRPEHLVGAEFVLDDAITPRHAGRWRLPDTDRSNSPWCRRPRPLDHSACGVTADRAARLRAHAATPPPKTGEGLVGSGPAEEGRHRRERCLMRPSAHETTMRRDHRLGVTGDARN